jgi:hypothetical protein
VTDRALQLRQANRRQVHKFKSQRPC